jgi:hypothetical protein
MCQLLEQTLAVSQAANKQGAGNLSLSETVFMLVYPGQYKEER